MQIESRLKTHPTKSRDKAEWHRKKCKFNAQFTQPQKCVRFCVKIEIRVGNKKLNKNLSARLRAYKALKHKASLAGNKLLGAQKIKKVRHQTE